jgi:hypothetical protein
MGFLRLALVAAVAALVPAPSAGAAGTERIVVDRLSDTYDVAVDCSAVGPYEFEVLASGSERISITDVVATDGTLLQTVFNARFREIDTNSRTGGTLPLSGAIHEVWTYATNTRTIDGMVFLGTEPGSGTYVQDTGRIVMTLDEHEASFVAGPHEAFFGGGIDVVGCAAMAKV